MGAVVLVLRPATGKNAKPTEVHAEWYGMPEKDFRIEDLTAPQLLGFQLIGLIDELHARSVSARKQQPATQEKNDA